jgi:hypothetical protein
VKNAFVLGSYYKINEIYSISLILFSKKNLLFDQRSLDVDSSKCKGQVFNHDSVIGMVCLATEDDNLRLNQIRQGGPGKSS